MRLFSSMRSPTLRRLARALFVIGIIGCAWPEPTVAQTDPTLTRRAILLAEREAKRQDLTPEQFSRAEERMRAFETLRLPRAIFVKGFNGPARFWVACRAGRDSPSAGVTSTV